MCIKMLFMWDPATKERSACEKLFAKIIMPIFRVCMVNDDGVVLLDQYVRPEEKVTDYRTFVSGIEPKHLKDGAVSLAEAQKMVAKILTGRVLVGHAVHHDLKVCSLHCCHIHSCASSRTG